MLIGEVVAAVLESWVMKALGMALVRRATFGGHSLKIRRQQELRRRHDPLGLAPRRSAARKACGRLVPRRAPPAAASPRAVLRAAQQPAPAEQQTDRRAIGLGRKHARRQVTRLCPGGGMNWAWMDSTNGRREEARNFCRRHVWK